LKNFRQSCAAAIVALAAATASAAQTTPSAPIPIQVLEQGPAATTTELQIICLFQSSPSNTLHGSLIEIDEKLTGLLNRIRTPALFRGELGETLLISPPPGTIPAKRLLVIGLGDSQSFTLERMELVGSIAYREARRLGVAHPFFAPTLLDGGVTKYTTGQTAEQVIRGFFRAAATETVLNQAQASTGVGLADLTYLAGPKNVLSTQQGIQKALAAAVQ
jgi:hypothetical protein